MSANTASSQFETVLSIFINRDTLLGNEDTIRCFKEDPKVALLLSDDITRGPNVLVRIFRDYLVLKGFKYMQNLKSNKLTYGLVNWFIDDKEDKEFALERLATLPS